MSNCLQAVLTSTPTPLTQEMTTSSRDVLRRVLVDIVLILADADGFGVELDEFGERVHEAAADGDGAADGEIVVGEFFARDFGGGVDGGAGFVDHDDRESDCGQALRRADEGFGLASGGAVADGDGFDLELGDECLTVSFGFARSRCGPGRGR